MPLTGILRFEYVRKSRQVRSIVHYSLELGEPLEREVAVQLWQRAIIEEGENWQKESLDGLLLDLDEEAAAAWTVPKSGLLELDYVTFDRLFEAHYRLDLKKPDERAIACKLQVSGRGVGSHCIPATPACSHSRYGPIPLAPSLPRRQRAPRLAEEREYKATGRDCRRPPVGCTRLAMQMAFRARA